eukprot:jgi/Chrpa1/27086/Chrysochromulina_OHIO_Genome00025460-RA
MAYGTTYRLVYSFDTVTDKCSLWVNPTSEASTRIMTANPIAADTTISAVAFRQTSSTPPWAISIRNLIVSTTFAEACPPPPPPSPSQFRANLGALIGVNMTYITIRVSADSAPGSTIVQATMIVPDLPASQSVMSVLSGANNTAHLSASLGVNVSSVTDVQTTSFVMSAPSPPPPSPPPPSPPPPSPPPPSPPPSPPPPSPPPSPPPPSPPPSPPPPSPPPSPPPPSPPPSPPPPSPPPSPPPPSPPPPSPPPPSPPPSPPPPSPPPSPPP